MSSNCFILAADPTFSLVFFRPRLACLHGHWHEGPCAHPPTLLEFVKLSCCFPRSPPPAFPHRSLTKVTLYFPPLSADRPTYTSFKLGHIAFLRCHFLSAFFAAGVSPWENVLCRLLPHLTIFFRRFCDLRFPPLNSPVLFLSSPFARIRCRFLSMGGPFRAPLVPWCEFFLASPNGLRQLHPMLLPSVLYTFPPLPPSHSFA